MQLKNEKELLNLAEDLSTFGTWELDLKTNQLSWSDGVFRMCGYEPGEFEVTFESGLTVIHPEDQSLAIAKMNEALTQGTSYEIRKRFIKKNKEIIHVLSKGKVVFDQDQTPLKLFGVFQDITNAVKLEESYQNAINDLRSRNQFIQTIVENLPIGIAVNKMSTGEATMVNKSFAAIYGWSDEDLTDIQTFFEKVYPDETYRKEIMERIMADIASGDPRRMIWKNIEVRTSQNEKRIVDAKNIPLFDQDLMISTVVDVTENVKLSEQTKTQEANLQALIENTPDLIYSVDINFKLLTYNSAFAQLIKKLTGVVIHKGINVFDAYSERKKKSYLSIYNQVKAGQRYVFIDVVEFEDQKFYYDVAVNSILDANQQIIGFSIFSKDITAQKKNAEALKQSNQLLKNAQKITKMGNWEYSTETEEMFWADEIYHIFEIEKTPHQKLKLEDFTKFIHPEDLNSFLDGFKKLKEEGIPLDVQHRIITSNQSIKHVKELGERIFNQETNSYWIWATIRDNTENFSTLSNLKKSEKKYKYLFENNPASMFIFDFKTLEIIDCNEEALLQYGYTREEFLSLSIRDIRPKEDLDLINHATKDEETYGKIHKKAWRHSKKNGEIFYVNINGHLIDFEGKRCSLVQITDITSQLKAQEEIRNSEEKYRILYQESPVPKVIYDAKNLSILDINEYAIKLYGYSREEFLSKTIYDLRIPEDHESVPDIFKRVKNLGGNENFGVFKHRKKDGTIIEVEFYAYKFNFEGKEALIAVYIDVTDKQQAIRDLLDKEEKLTLAQSLAKIGNWDYDIALAKFNWSPEIFKIFEINKETFDLNNNGSLIHFIDREDQEKALTIRDEALTTGNSFKTEYRITTKNGKKKVIEEVGYGERDENGTLIRFFGTSQDITERKNAEEQIKESELKYRSFFENSMDGILLTVTDGEILAANPAACEIFQMTEEEIIKKGRLGLVDTKDPRLYELLEKRQKNGNARGELRLKRKDGSFFEGELASTRFLDAQGQERTSMIVRDVTKQKEYEKAMLESNQRFEYVTQATSDAIWDWNLENNNIFWGLGFAHIFGFSKKEIETNFSFWAEKVHPDDRERVEAGLRKAQKGKESRWADEYRFKNGAGKYCYVYDQGFVIRDADGKAIRMVGAMSDVTQRVEHTKAIEFRNKQLQEIAYTQSHIVRAPLARILGIINLMKELNVTPPDSEELMHYLFLSATELDEVIKSIVRNTERTDT
ncbi:MAG: PAS domain S-box protein [Sphingobacteriales bacterium]|nr:PAS domain S-box protein [Sphingobacteriales bacterium]